MKTSIIKKYFYENISQNQGAFSDNIKCCCYTNLTDFPVLHNHVDYWEFMILLDGILKNVYTTREDIIRPNTFFLSTTDDVHCLIRYAPPRIYAFNITVRADIIESILRVFPAETIDVLKKQRLPFYTLSSDILMDIKRSIYQYNLLKPNQYEEGNSILLSVVFQLLGIAINKVIGYTRSNTRNSEFCRQLSAIMSNPNSVCYSVVDLCRFMNYSRAQLDRRFQRELNTSPHDYLVEKRMIYAQNLLQQSDLTVISIAQTIGYANLSQFNVNFKRKFGISPSQFRKLQKIPDVSRVEHHKQ